VLFWRDMLGVGTLLNIAASFGALMLASQGAATALAVALHFAPVPYNVFLFAAFWRMPARALWMSAVAVVWLALMTLV
jgi:hypothetical protein